MVSLEGISQRAATIDAQDLSRRVGYMYASAASFGSPTLGSGWRLVMHSNCSARRSSGMLSHGADQTRTHRIHYIHPDRRWFDGEPTRQMLDGTRHRRAQSRTLSVFGVGAFGALLARRRKKNVA